MNRPGTRGVTPPLLVLACLATPRDARGQDVAPPPAAHDDAASTPDASLSLSHKRPMTAYDLERKKEGDYFAPIPLLDSDPDTGYGVGLRVYRYWNGERIDPMFRYSPYRVRVFAEEFFTTLGYTDAKLDFDAPYVLGSPYRVRAALTYERNIAQNYFGRGASTMGDLTFTGAGRSYGSFAAYTTALEQIGSDHVAHTLYDKYDLQDPVLSAVIERDLLGGLVRVQLGPSASIVSVHDYTGSATVGNGPLAGMNQVPAIMGTTRLKEDCDAGRISGCSGGLNGVLKAGVALDTRDYEPDPNSGVFVDLTAEVSSRALGSSFDYARVTLAPRVFVSPLPRLTDLVLAARAVYSVQTDGVPFFAMNDLAFTDTDRQGLGGLWTLRGYKQDRFVGAVSALTNLELRWTFWDGLHVAGQDFAFILVPFTDLGRVFDRVQDFTFAGWRTGEGAGLRVAWNKATVVVFDYGVSTEDSGLYIDFQHQF